MNILLHLLTFSSEFNAIPLRCPFHALAIVQVGFASAEMFCAPSFFRVLDKVNVCYCFCCTTLHFPRAPDLNCITKKRVLGSGSVGTPVSLAPRSRHCQLSLFLAFFLPISLQSILCLHPPMISVRMFSSLHCRGSTKRSVGALWLRAMHVFSVRHKSQLESPVL